MADVIRVPNRLVLSRALGGQPEAIRAFEGLARIGATTVPGIEEVINETVNFSIYLERAEGDYLKAFELAFAACAAMIDSGEYGRVYLMLNGRNMYIPPPGLKVPKTAKYITMMRGGFIPVAGDWTEDNEADIAHLAEYEKVTKQGKVWDHRKPIITLEEGCIGFQMVDIYVDGKGAAETRQCAGVRVLGPTADRKWVGGKVENCETYGIYIGDKDKNNGAVDITGVEIKPNSRNSRQDRTAYGLIVSGNDMKMTDLTISNAHAALLVTTSGATTFFINCDFFNGARFDIEGFQHRSIEYHGNSCTFRSARHGNGQAHWYSHDVFIFPSKFGITEGTGDDPPLSYHHFYPSKLDDDLGKFGQFWGETPIDLITEIAWFRVEPGDGITTSWAIDTAKLENYKGYVTTIPSGKFVFLQMANTDKTLTLATLVEGAKLLIEDKDTDKEVGASAYGNALELLADGRQWRVQTNGVLRGGDDNLSPKIGTDATPISQITSKQYEFVPGTPTTPDTGVYGAFFDASNRLTMITPGGASKNLPLFASPNADAIPAGTVGEFKELRVNSGAAVSLTTATPVNLGSLTLEPGKWDVDLAIVFVGSGASVTGIAGSISETSATMVTNAADQYAAQGSNLTAYTGTIGRISAGTYQVSEDAPVTLYAVAQGNFSAGTMTAYGYMRARRPA